MCRLFGFRSVIPSQVHRSLLSADNALGTQSSQHPDGWGVAFYVDGSPHLTKSPSTAHYLPNIAGFEHADFCLLPTPPIEASTSPLTVIAPRPWIVRTSRST